MRRRHNNGVVQRAERRRAMSVQPIPDDYPRLSPYLTCDGAADAVAFYSEVFGFAQRGPAMTAPDGRIGHLELELGGSLLMLADRFDDSQGVVGDLPHLMLYVADVDATYQLALDRGAEGLEPPTDQFYGDRKATIRDAWGYRWTVCAHVEDVPMDEMVRRATAAMSGE
jgi:PhnB protein